MSDSEGDFSRLFHDSYSDNFDDDDASGSSKVALRNYVDVRVCPPYAQYKSYKSPISFAQLVALCTVTQVILHPFCITHYALVLIYLPHR